MNVYVMRQICDVTPRSVAFLPTSNLWVGVKIKYDANLVPLVSLAKPFQAQGDIAFSISAYAWKARALILMPCAWKNVWPAKLLWPFVLHLSTSVFANSIALGGTKLLKLLVGSGNPWSCTIAGVRLKYFKIDILQYNSAFLRCNKLNTYFKSVFLNIYNYTYKTPFYKASHIYSCTTTRFHSMS